MQKNWMWRAVGVGVVLLAFALRLRYLTLFIYHMDEFYSMAAGKIIAEEGIPYFPSGLIYQRGLLFSYLEGLLFWLLGFSEALGRWPSVIFSTLAVATLYWLGARVLRSKGVGLLAVLLLTFSIDSLEWGGRARMSSLAQWLVLLSVVLLWIGLTRPSTRHRLLFIASYSAALLSHFATIVLLPAWLVAAVALWWARVVDLQRKLFRDGIILLIACSLALSSAIILQPPPTVDYQQTDQALSDKFEALGDFYLQVSLPDVTSAWQAYIPYFLGWPHWPVFALALVGIIIAFIRLASGQRKPRDIGAVFLSVIFITVIAVLVLLVDPHWRRSRYLMMQCTGIFFLLGAYGFREILLWFPFPQKRLRFWQASAAVAGSVIILTPFLALLPPTIERNGQGWFRYDLAYRYVQEHLDTNDKIMTMHPAASLLYVGKNDYYLVRWTSKLIVRPDGSLGDYYTGSTWLKTMDDFNRAFDESDRLWFVTEEAWLFKEYDGDLQQQILWRMEKRWGIGGVWTRGSRPGRVPLALEIEHPFTGELQEGTRLVGFTANPTVIEPGEEVQLTLFWQPKSIPFGLKAFVQVRDAQNNTVAQDDHFIYDDVVPISRWPKLLAGDEYIRDGAVLKIPADLPPGTYRVLVGFYHPETLQRIAVANDQSGENALILTEFVIE